MDQAKLDAFMGQVVDEFSVIASGVMANVGHKLGFYKAMDGAGPITAEQLADKTQCYLRYVQEWLNNQAAGGYVEYDATNGTYELPEEHAVVLAREGGTTFLAPGFDVMSSFWLDEDKILEAFKSPRSLPWGAHHPRLFTGVEGFFRPALLENLVPNWIPAFEGLEDKLKAGAKVADIGCGHGVHTIIMVEAFPKSTFYGFDSHGPSVETARQRAKEAGVEDRVRFEQATAKDFPGDGYDLACFFDSLHDMGDPRGAAEYTRQKLKADGTVLLLEPNAGDKVEDNLNSVGRMFYAGSTASCCPASVSQEVGTALGAQAGQARLSSVLKDAGFSNVRRAGETPFNIVLEVRP